MGSVPGSRGRTEGCREGLNRYPDAQCGALRAQLAGRLKEKKAMIQDE